MKIVAIDPGGTTGFAIYSTDDNKHWTKERIGCRTEREQIYMLLHSEAPSLVVCEDYKLFPWKSHAQAWSQLDTVKVIGGVEAYTLTKGIPLELQTTDNRDIGYMWGEIKKLPKSNPSNHAHDADAHAVYYII